MTWAGDLAFREIMHSPDRLGGGRVLHPPSAERLAARVSPQEYPGSSETVSWPKAQTIRRLTTAFHFLLPDLGNRVIN
jgi:hypothetical protein